MHFTYDNPYYEVNIIIAESWFNGRGFSFIGHKFSSKKVTISMIMKIRALSVYIKESPQTQEK
jgi:hypothetical protein